MLTLDADIPGLSSPVGEVQVERRDVEEIPGKIMRRLDLVDQIMS